MDPKLIARINELAAKKKLTGLTKEETVEQKKLRQQYLEIFRHGVNSHLLNVKVVDPEGKNVTPAKLVKAQKIHKQKS